MNKRTLKTWKEQEQTAVQQDLQRIKVEAKQNLWAQDLQKEKN